MGNRAVITTERKEEAIYMHWNGGRDSIEPILQFCKETLKLECPSTNKNSWSTLSQLLNLMYNYGEITQYHRTDINNFDNGVYIIKDWEIVAREYQRYDEQAEYPPEEVKAEITRIYKEFLETTLDKLK